MEPIVSPMIFYLVETLDNIRALACIMSFIIFLGTGGLLMFIGIDDFKLYKFKFICAFILLTICLFLATFVPSKSTMYTMLVAKQITYDRVNKVAEVGKDVRESIKQDIIDIFKELDKKDKKDKKER